MHLSAYALWRINWIHPFVDGNGRTARILSYAILCGKYGFRLPGSKTIPEQIASDKKPYYSALEAADSKFELAQIDVLSLEKLIEDALAIQLESALPKTPQANVVTRQSPTVNEDDLFISRRQTIEKIMLTVNVSNEAPAVKGNFIERNPSATAMISTIIAAVISSLLTWYLVG